MLSEIFLPLMKAFWKGVMRQSIKGISLLTRILEITLNMTLHKLIGLKWLTLSGQEFLGIRVMKVWLSVLSKEPEWKKA